MLRQAKLVESRKDGKYVLYRLAADSVGDLWVSLRGEAEARLVELQAALASIVEHGDQLQGIDRREILKRAQSGEVVVLDVRPAAEFASGHLPHARSLPLAELRKKLAGLPKQTPVVAYCRGPFCLMARDGPVAREGLSGLPPDRRRRRVARTRAAGRSLIRSCTA
jgi:hypothetical protein